MTRTHEKLLIAALAGLIIAGAAVFAIQPSLAGKASSNFSTPAPSVLTLKLFS